MTGVLIEKGNLDTDTHTRKMPCEDGTRDQRDASTSQRTPKTATTPPDARGGTWNRLLLTALLGNQPT